MSQKLTDPQKLRALLDRYVHEQTWSFDGFTTLDVNSVGNDKATPLHVACTRGAFEDVEILIGGGADVNAKTDMGLTPLLNAVYSRNIDIVRLLLKENADPYAQHVCGESPVSAARRMKMPEIERELMDAMCANPPISPNG